jgi:hypothetical protein
MQVAHKTRLGQWQDGKKVIVWPEELAPGQPRFPTPPWGQRAPITEAVADVAEEYRMPMVAPGASASSIFKKGRKYVFMVFSPGQGYLEGAVDIAARSGLKTFAIIYENTIASKGIAEGAIELAGKKGPKAVFVESSPREPPISPRC